MNHLKLYLIKVTGVWNEKGSRIYPANYCMIILVAAKEKRQKNGLSRIKVIDLTTWSAIFFNI